VSVGLAKAEADLPERVRIGEARPQANADPPDRVRAGKQGRPMPICPTGFVSARRGRRLMPTPDRVRVGEARPQTDADPPDGFVPAGGVRRMPPRA